MNDWLAIVLAIIGLVGGTIVLVDNAKKLAVRFRVPEILIGLTIISIGTSFPEIFTNIFSALHSSTLGVDATSGVALGTNIGSCLTQITLILGLTGLISHLKADKMTMRFDGTMILVAIIVLFVFAFFFPGPGGEYMINPWEAIIMMLLYVVYLFVTSRSHAHVKMISQDVSGVFFHKRKAWFHIAKEVFLVLFGLAVLLLAADVVVKRSVHIAQVLGVSPSVIGVLIIGVGTALPELSTAIIGIARNAKGVSIGTLIGSNVTDPLLSTGAGAVIAGLKVDPSLLFFDIPFWFVATFIALALIYHKNMALDRRESAVLIGVYAVFVVMKLVLFV